jgi:hypothetical protein
MRKTGEVLARSNMGNIGSIRAALKLPSERVWNRDDLVWFAKGDYLYRSNALESLDRASAVCGGADCFGLYALIGNRMPNGEPRQDKRIPKQWKRGEAQLVNGEIWRKALSTTSTFGARARTIEADRKMMFAAMRCGGAFDHSKCVTYREFTPYPLSFLGQAVSAAEGPIGVARELLIAVVRASFNGYAAARCATSRRSLIASDPSLATHFEAAFLAIGSDWRAIAADTGVWMQANGLELRLPVDLQAQNSATSPPSPKQIS